MYISIYIFLSWGRSFMLPGPTLVWLDQNNCGCLSSHPWPRQSEQIWERHHNECLLSSLHFIISDCEWKEKHSVNDQSQAAVMIRHHQFLLDVLVGHKHTMSRRPLCQDRKWKGKSQGDKSQRGNWGGNSQKNTWTAVCRRRIERTDCTLTTPEISKWPLQVMVIYNYNYITDLLALTFYHCVCVYRQHTHTHTHTYQGQIYSTTCTNWLVK